MLILTAIVFGPTLLLSAAASSMSADEGREAGVILLAQADTPTPVRPHAEEPSAPKARPRARGKAPGKADQPPAKAEAPRSRPRRSGGTPPRGSGDVPTQASTRAAPSPTAETSKARNGDRPAPAQENTGAGTMTRGATGADSPLNNVTPPSRNDRPVRRSDERASGTGDGRAPR
jgi:hypothetical protein